MLINLLDETIKKLNDNGKTLEDIEWIGNTEGYIPIETFKKLADVQYDNGYGSSKVASDLIINGKDFIMTRNEYDGSEWWDFNEILPKPQKELSVQRLIGGMWDDLETINNDDYDENNY